MQMTKPPLMLKFSVPNSSIFFILSIFFDSLCFLLFLIYEFNKWVSLFLWFPEEPDDDSVHVFTGHTGKISSSSSLLSFFLKFIYLLIYAFEQFETI